MIIDGHQHFWIASRGDYHWMGTRRAPILCRENVYCKLSGMIIEADRGAWKPADLSPYIEHAFASFGANRLMFGSDWPVCSLAGSYTDVMNVVRAILGPRLDIDQTTKVFGQNAARFYGLGGAA